MKHLIHCIALLFFTACFAVESPRAQMLEHFAGAWTTQALTCVAKLDVATKIGNGNLSIDTLAKLCDCNEEKLGRVMRMLSSKGIFQEVEQNIFCNNEASELLCHDHPDTMRHLAMWYGEEMYRALDSLYDGVKSNTIPFNIAFNSHVFAYMKQHPEMQKRFLLAMQEKAMMAIASCFEVFDFSQFESIYDIGGGNGAFIKAITHRFPSVKGAVFELPSVADQITPSPRYSILRGDFFDEVPHGAECYLLKSVLHDWDDEKALHILKNCYQAMSSSGTLIIIEPVVKGANLPDYAKQLDILMLAITGGKERSESEMTQLLRDAGFSLKEVIDTSTEFKMLIARKA